MNDVQEQRKKLMDTAFGNHDIECFMTKRQSSVDNAKIDLAHNLTKNEFVLITAGGGASLDALTIDEAKSIMEDGYKLLWKHTKDVGTTYYDPETGEVKFWPYTGKKSEVTI